MNKELSTVYEHESVEKIIYDQWMTEKAFAATPDDRKNRYVIMMPLPNVTGALHMGHAMDNVMQDLLVRWHRMMGDNTLWMPGTDHAGIATQAVIEKRLLELEGKTRHDVGREELVARIWKWKDQYEQRIIQQQQSMGCSCDWDRQRFTLDKVCYAAVRETFFSMFTDRLIYRGNRLVNWDCHLQTAVSDDEIIYETVQGYFWYLKYPIVNPKPGEPEFVIVATTRPETMLGDTAVACHPDPAGALNGQIESLKERISHSSEKESDILEQELQRLKERKKSHLADLEKFVEMAKDNRQVILPLQNLKIPLIMDEWAKPELGSGCVKITPGHDPNDYEVWDRHKDEISIVNILNPDGTLNENAGAYAGLDRFKAREKVVADLQIQGKVALIEEHEVEMGHSDRSKTLIEPYLSKQWFIHMDDVSEGIVCGRGTENEFRASGLAQAAMDAAEGKWKSPTGRKVDFHPDPVRYSNTYCNWLAEKRDWCISRQLWWGHRIPIWSASVKYRQLTQMIDMLKELDEKDISYLVVDSQDQPVNIDEINEKTAKDAVFEIQVCSRSKKTDEKYALIFDQSGLQQDPDVLDTWFSSALWPHSTLGWPDPENAKVNKGQSLTCSLNGKPDALSCYYPGSCLVTARDIITLWVARMVIAGLYNLGDVPFTDVFIHANILDGKGERMSKSKGNGIDPEDIIERYGADAMRYVLCDMQTGTQDIRLPVQAISPYTGEPVDLATAKHGRSVFTYICPETEKEFDVLGTISELPSAKIISDRFEIGRNFCNKLWNAARFVLLNLKAQDFKPLSDKDLFIEDCWILSRLSLIITEVSEHLNNYNPSSAIGCIRNFFWSEFCDWYLELIKPRLWNESEAFVARQVVAGVLDQILRLFHPFVPFITEEIWNHLEKYMPSRGIEKMFPGSQLLILAPWPKPDIYQRDKILEDEFDLMRDVIRNIRNVRSKHNISPAKKIKASIKAEDKAETILKRMKDSIIQLCNLSFLEISSSVQRLGHSAVQQVGDVEIYLEGVLDLKKERQRLETRRKKLVKKLVPIQNKLENQEFMSRAPDHIQEKERKKHEEIQNELSKIEEKIAGLP